MGAEHERTRILGWEGCFNVRELGGYATVDGRETRWRAVIRADSPARLSEVGCAALIDYGVRTIIDLRLPQELEERPNPFAAPNGRGIVYLNLSLIDPAFGPKPPFATLADDYKGVLARFAPQFMAIMAAIARAADGTVLVHCAAGKDRTGLVVALLLSVAGVPQETIAADYALSGECLRPWQEAWLENGPGERIERERELAWGGPRPGVMVELLTHLDQRHGGAERYLLASGVPPADVRRLRERLLA